VSEARFRHAANKMPCHRAGTAESSDVHRTGRSLLWAAALALAWAAPAWANRGNDLARIHLEALGGRDRITALAAVRATGHVLQGGKRVNFHLTAARPAKLRLEMEGGSRTMVQGYDGVDSPWEFDTGKWPPRYITMAENSARTFIADAEFDDPLVSAETRGYTFDYGGEVKGDGRPMLQVLVTRNLKEQFALLLDAETYLIAMRVERRSSVGGRPIQIVTRFDDYRPVEGVLLPHKVTVAVDGRVTQQSVIESIEPNPKTTSETFTRPKAAAKQ
jgi:hypothetical protein